MGMPQMNEMSTLIADNSSLVYLKLARPFILGKYSSMRAVVIASAATIFEINKINKLS